jgi:hypothetical protein
MGDNLGSDAVGVSHSTEDWVETNVEPLRPMLRRGDPVRALLRIWHTNGIQSSFSMGHITDAMVQLRFVQDHRVSMTG